MKGTLDQLRDKAIKEPLGSDISDYSDEWQAGFLAGQANALDEVWRRGLTLIPLDLAQRQLDQMMDEIAERGGATRALTPMRSSAT